MTTLSELLDAAILSKMADLHTCFPGRIESYDHTQQRASVKPLLNRKLKDGTIESMPVLSNVMVWMPRSGGASVTLPVAIGDTCLVACTERSIDEWRARGGVQTPADTRKNALFDAVAFVGLIPFSVGSLAENNSDLLITAGATKIRVKQSGAVEIQDATVTVINGDVIADGVSLKTHVHSGVQAGASLTGAPA